MMLRFARTQVSDDNATLQLAFKLFFLTLLLISRHLIKARRHQSHRCFKDTYSYRKFLLA